MTNDPGDVIYYTAWLLIHDKAFRESHKQVTPRAFPRGALQYLVALALRINEDLSLPVIRSMVPPDTDNLRRHGTEAPLVIDIYQDLTSGYDIKDDSLSTMRQVCGHWLQQRALTYGVGEAAKALEKADLDEARRLLGQAQYEIEETEPPLDALEHADYLLAGARWRKDDAIPTGLPDLDAAWMGGIRPPELGIVMGYTGMGKCHAKGQGILLFDGTVKLVEDIQVGDVLRGPDQTPRHVLALGRGREEMRRITPTKGESFTVTAGHVLTLVHTRTGETLDVPVNEWEQWIAGRKLLYKLMRAETCAWPAQEGLPLPPRLLGIWLGAGGCGRDGHYTRVTTADEEILTYLTDWAQENGLHVAPCGKYSYALSGEAGKPNPLRDSLRTLGLWQHTSGDKFIPSQYKVGSILQRQELLAGLLDTDGYLSSGCYDYISKSQRLAEDVAFVARSLGMAAYVLFCQKRDQYGRGGTYYRVGISGDTQQIPCLLSRKVAAARKQKKSVLRTGFTVEHLPVADYYGFVLDGDHRYLLSDFTVTHNSMWLCMFAAAAFWAGRSVLYYSTELTPAEINTRWLLGVLERGMNTLPKDKPYAELLFETAVRRKTTISKKAHMRAEWAPQSVLELPARLEDYKREFGAYPGLLIIDSPIDFAAPGKFNGTWEGHRATYIRLRALAQALNIPIWTSAQTNKEAIGKAYSSLKFLGDAYAMAQKAHYLIGLTQTLEQGETADGRREPMMVAYILKDTHHGQTGGAIEVTPKFGDGNNGYPGVEQGRASYLHLPMKEAE